MWSVSYYRQTNYKFVKPMINDITDLIKIVFHFCVKQKEKTKMLKRMSVLIFVLVNEFEQEIHFLWENKILNCAISLFCWMSFIKRSVLASKNCLTLIDLGGACSLMKFSGQNLKTLYSKRYYLVIIGVIRVIIWSKYNFFSFSRECSPLNVES